MNSMQDYALRNGTAALFGDAVVAPRLDDISVQFQYNIATRDIVSGGVVTGSGAVAHDGVNMMNVTAGTGSAAGTATAQSVDTVRYRTGHDIYCYFTARWSTPAAGCKQYIGLFDANNGIALGYNGTSFGWLLRSGGVDYFTEDRYFSLNSLRDDIADGNSGFTLNKQKINLFRISFGYLGIAPIVIEVYAGREYGGWLPFVWNEFHNKQETTHLQNPNLPMSAYVSSNGSAVVGVYTASWNAGVMLFEQVDKADRHTTTRNSKTGVTTETNLLTVRNLSTFQSKTNYIPALVEYVSVSTEGTKPATFYLKKGVTLGGSPSYSNLDAVNSTLQRDTAGTTITGGTLEFSVELAKEDSKVVDLEKYHIVLLPGETLTISAESAAATEAAVTISFKEIF